MSNFLKVWVALVVALLLAPTLVVIPMSFSDSTTFSFPPKGWSLRWYQNFFQSPEWVDALLDSLKVGVAAAVIATVVGTAAAVALDRSRFRGRSAVQGAMMAPAIVPSIVIAVAIYIMFLKWHLTGSLLGFVAAHSILAVPFVIVTVSTALSNYDRTVEYASASLGAGPITTFRRIVLPSLAPGIASGFVFAFVTSFDEVVVALFLQTPDLRTLPVKMYNSITLQIDPTIAAASSLIVVITTGVLLLAQFLPRRRNENAS
ncbi:ABC transporter permease [Rhodococcus sp. NPDC057014]|uniref:ABC transporter permease n=1 Tax=Rhodococcus sp. NPDC057014 TaxID=3346000 RepID=UPI00362A6CDF